jgi:hypothetical protein
MRGLDSCVTLAELSAAAGQTGTPKSEYLTIQEAVRRASLSPKTGFRRASEAARALPSVMRKTAWTACQFCDCGSQ